MVGLADLLQASRWQIDLRRPVDAAASAVAAFLATEAVPVQRMTKKGLREFDCRAAVLGLTVDAASTRAPASTWCCDTP